MVSRRLGRRWVFKPEEEDPAVRDWKVAMLDKVFAPPSADEADAERLNAAFRRGLAAAMEKPIGDPVSMPSHYTQLPVEAIDITEHFNFCLGNALKYIWRADHKGKPLEDLRKAIWYLQREVARRERE